MNFCPSVFNVCAFPANINPSFIIIKVTATGLCMNRLNNHALKNTFCKLQNDEFILMGGGTLFFVCLTFLRDNGILYYRLLDVQISCNKVCV